MSIEINLIKHRGSNWILLCFVANDAWNKRMKKVAGSRWSKTHKGWLVPDNTENRWLCKLKPQTTPGILPQNNQIPLVVKAHPISLNSENNEAMREFIRHLELKKYSANGYYFY